MPICTCKNCLCGGTRAFVEHYHMEYVMSFLMGLHDSFAQVRGQLLLMDYIPPINKVFALIFQEENQRNVVNQTIENDSILFNVKHDVHKTGHGQSTKKERSLCTHCGLHGRTIDKCYKLHEYSPRYKFKKRNTSQIHPNQMNPTINLVCESHQNLSSSNQVMGDFMQTLSPT